MSEANPTTLPFSFMKRVILYGGSFDPVHKGHIEVAKASSDQLGAENVYFVPARRSPFKENPPQAGDSDRGKMLEIAVSSIPGFCVSYTEFERPEPSYSYDTVKYYHERFDRQTEIIWLVGADTLSGLKDWYRIKDMLGMCKIAAMYRGGCHKFDRQQLCDLLGRELAEMDRVVPVETPLIDISSTEVRKRLARGCDVSQMLDPGVLRYIRDNRLYES
jgi:nicotinate-nucleotide adenylyltransferase